MSKTVTFGGVMTITPNNKNLNNNNPNMNNKNILKDPNKLSKEAPEGKPTIKDRFNCGALRRSLKMVSSNGSTLIAVRLIHSKLRKREEHSVITTTATQQQIKRPTLPTHFQTTQVQQITSQQQDRENGNIPQVEPLPFFWRYSSTTTVNSSQYLCNSSQDTLVHALPCEEVSECKGFRKNLRGKWKRLVKKKTQPEVYTIPAELRDQLKQIYVY